MERNSDVRGSSLSRREFGILAAAGATALGMPASARSASDAPAPLSSTPGPQARVGLAGVPRGAGDAATEEAVRQAALAVTDFDWLSRGDTVLIKAVSNSGNVYPATTDPRALRAMIGLLRERGAGRVIVADMSGVQFVRFHPDSLEGSSRALMQRNGILQAALDAGAEFHAFEEAGWDGFFEDTPTVAGSWAGSLMLPAILREVDHIVLMPRCARHILAGSTLGLKAAVGWWRHDSRLEYHRDAGSFSEKTADANTVPAIRDKQRLVLTSATQILTTLGPDSGAVVTPETGLVLASGDVVSHDMVSLAWLIESRSGMDPSERDGLFDDPNNSETFVNLANRVVTVWLGGFGQALRAERLRRYDLEQIGDDRVLRRAFHAFGGIPQLELVDTDGSVPESLRQALEARTRIAA